MPTNFDAISRHEPVRRRDQAECERGDDHHAHVHRIDIGVLGEVDDQRHENDDGRNGVDEIADDDEQQHQQQHDQEWIAAGGVRDPVRNHRRSAQIGQHPAERRGRADRDQRNGIEQPRVRHVARQIAQMPEIEQRDRDEDNVGDRDDAGFGRGELAGENAAHDDDRDHQRDCGFFGRGRELSRRSHACA